MAGNMLVIQTLHAQSVKLDVQPPQPLLHIDIVHSVNHDPSMQPVFKTGSCLQNSFLDRKKVL